MSYTAAFARSPVLSTLFTGFGVGGSTSTLTTSGWAPNEVLDVQRLDGSALPPGTAADSNGNYQLQQTIPTAPDGTGAQLLTTIRSRTRPTQHTAAVVRSPRLVTVTPSAGDENASVAVDMTGFSPNEQVNIRTLDGTFLPPVQVAADGTYHLNMTIPAGQSATTFYAEATSPSTGAFYRAAVARTSTESDTTPPSITSSVSPAPNGFGWNNGPVSVTFHCDDDSGVSSCGPDVVLNDEGAGQVVTGTAVDNFGNSSQTTSGPVSIDLGAPTLSGTAMTSPNAADWYNGDVTIHWTASDALSGIDPTTSPADSIISGEGAALTAGATVSDRAGNITTATSAPAVNIDRHAPTITAEVVNPSDGSPRSPNANGWYSSAVTVRFTCTDALSGIALCPGDLVLSSDGTNQSAAGTADDMAGNAATFTLTGINIDSHTPSTSAALTCTGGPAACSGSNATVALDATDPNGSGVQSITYRVDSGAPVTVAGDHADVAVTFPLGSGSSTVYFYATDLAGNAEPQHSTVVTYDNLAPVVAHVVAPTPNAAGWSASDTTVHFDATDDAGGSGVDPITVTPDRLLTTETAGTVVHGQASDYAGNTGTDQVTVKLDRTPPTVSAAATTAPNANGWYNGPVTVHFTCADALSGLAVCPGDIVLTGNGTNQSASGTAIDTAGNMASATVTGINIDGNPPIVNINGVTNGATYALGSAPPPSCSASDTLSGLTGPCVGVLTGGNSNGVGSFTYTARATDRAGNTTTVVATFTVGYIFDGFLAPISAQGHQTSTAPSFKAGSTVPVKFILRRADGTPITAAAAPVWLLPQAGASTSGAPNPALYSTPPPTTPITYSYDGTKYQYDYKTVAVQSGRYWQIGVKLDDGTFHTVEIALR